MNQHPMAKAYVSAFVKNGGKKFKSKFNMYGLDQIITFGYRRFAFELKTVYGTASYALELIPKCATRPGDCDEIYLSPYPNFGDWLACDQDAKADYEEFMGIVAKTIGIRK
jgi:hypothetical protein